MGLRRDRWLAGRKKGGKRERGMETYRSRTDHMIVGYDAQFPPAVHNGQKTQVVVLHSLLRFVAQTEFVQQFIFEQKFFLFLFLFLIISATTTLLLLLLLCPSISSEHSIPRSIYSLRKLLGLS